MNLQPLITIRCSFSLRCATRSQRLPPFFDHNVGSDWGLKHWRDGRDGPKKPAHRGNIWVPGNSCFHGACQGRSLWLANSLGPSTSFRWFLARCSSSVCLQACSTWGPSTNSPWDQPPWDFGSDRSLPMEWRNGPWFWSWGDPNVGLQVINKILLNS